MPQIQRAEHSEGWLQAVFEQASLPIALIDMRGRLVRSNPALQRLLGYSCEELRARTLDYITHPEDLRGDPDLLGELLRGERKGFEAENRYLRKDGEAVQAQIAVSMIGDEDGLPSHALATFRVPAEQRAAGGEDECGGQFSSGAPTPAELVTVLSAEGAILYASPSLERTLGLRRDDLVGRALLEHVHPEDRDGAAATLASLLAGPGESLSYELRVRHRDGSYRWLEGRGRNLLDDPSVNGIVTISRDATDRKDAEEAIGGDRALFEQVFDSRLYGALIADRTARVLRVNSEFTRLFGYSPEESVGRNVRELLLPEGREEEVAMITARILSGDCVQSETVRRRKDGSLLDVSIQGIPMRLPGDRTVMYVIFNDITARKENERALRESEERFRTLVEVLGEGIMITDLEDRILYVNRRTSEITGFAADELVGHVAAELLLPPEEQARMRARNRERGEGQSGRYETQQFRKDGTAMWVEVSGSPLHNSMGEVIGTVGALTDITGRKELEQALRQMSTTDLLTGLLNRRGFSEHAEREWTLAERRRHQLVLLFMDLDGFKPINDTFGHAEGDRLLQETAKLLRRCFRTSDIIARIGGDEFVVLAVDAAGETEASLAGRVHDAIAEFNRESGRPYQLRASIGVHRTCPCPANSLDAVLMEADRQMYERKRSR